MVRENQHNIVNIANLLSFLRMALIPLFLMTVIYGFPGWALIIFVTAGVTDGVDGYIARYWKQESSLGMYLDPMADKLLLTSAFILLAIMDLPNRLPVWLTVLVIARDVIIVTCAGLIFLTVGSGNLKPTFISKVNTFFQIVTIYVVLLFNYLNRTSLFVNLFIWITAITTFVSGIHYLLRMYLEPPEVEGE